MGDREAGLNREELCVLQADLDDESPQVLAAFVELALKRGALDAHLTPIYMKKNRPGVRVEVLCAEEKKIEFTKLMLTETSTLGVKARSVERYSLDRRMETVDFEGHPIRVKLAILEGVVLRAVPEFDDCKIAAEKLDKPVRDVIAEATRRFFESK